MRKSNFTEEQKEQEKEIIIKNLENSQDLKECAAKCDFSIQTLYNRMEEYEIDHSFRRGRRVGGRKFAKLG